MQNFDVCSTSQSYLWYTRCAHESSKVDTKLEYWKWNISLRFKWTSDLVLTRMHILLRTLINPKIYHQVTSTAIISFHAILKKKVQFLYIIIKRGMAMPRLKKPTQDRSSPSTTGAPSTNEKKSCNSEKI